jgi:UDP-glucose 4-epimerase
MILHRDSRRIEMILALGGSGFIGGNFVKRFSQKEKIRVLRRSKSYEPIGNNIEFVEEDFKYVDFNSLLQGVDTVFHFISSTVPLDGTERILDDIDENIVPTIKLLDAMKKKNIKKIFYVSSGGTIYGECDKPAIEDSKLSPECAYAVQKEIIENYMYLYEKYNDIQRYILRIANPYGFKTNQNKNQGIIPIFTQKVLKGETIEIWGTGENRRDYIYIDEVIDAIEAVYQYNGQHRIFNIGTGKSYSILEILRLIEKEIRIPVKIKYKGERKCDILNSQLDTSLIYRECGWKSKLTIEQGIKEYINMIFRKDCWE